MFSDEPEGATTMHATIATLTTTASLFSPATAASPAKQGLPSPPADGILCVLQGQHVHLRDGKGMVVTSQRGTLWVTQDGDARDWILEAGASQTFDGHADLLITAMSDAAIRLGNQG
jgi:hypothetical protein